MIIIGEIFEIINIISRIKENLKVSKRGFVHFILGIKIVTSNISQEAFIENLLNKYNINNKRKINTPCTG